MIEEEKNIEIRKLLKSLPDVKAGSDFEERLKEKISQLETDNESEKQKSEIKKTGFLESIFGSRKNPWLVPALGFSIVVLFTIYVTYTYRQSTFENFNDGSQEKNMNRQEAGDTNKGNIRIQEELKSAPETEHNKTPEAPVSPVDENKSSPESGRKTVTDSKPEAVETEIRKDETGTIKEEDDRNLIKEEIIPKSADEETEVEKKEKVTAPSMIPEESTGMEKATDRMMMKKDSSDSLKKLDSLNKIKLEKLRDKLNENK